jgi:phosphatidylethanolamine/phosphatidyl-N-methylethanolamine N-methyltransferase
MPLRRVALTSPRRGPGLRDCTADGVFIAEGYAAALAAATINVSTLTLRILAAIVVGEGFGIAVWHRIRRRAIHRPQLTAATFSKEDQPLSSTVVETIGWVRAWISDPLHVGAVVPSGRALAELITSEISFETGPVIELGAGTGAFTRALLARGVAEEELALVDDGPDFGHLLEFRFPRARTLRMDATYLKDVELFGGEAAGAVISGLPLLSMPPKKVIAILEGAFAHLRPHGAFYQFTYGPRCPVKRTLLDRLGLKAIRIGRTVANIPPAAVYRIRRRPSRPLVIASQRRRSVAEMRS